MDKVKEKETRKDFRGLKLVLNGMDITSKRMRRATLLFAWDKYVVHPEKEEKK